ncbi:MAG: dprA [Acidimicrobiales bacterium]|nr:dprA [Acidimicrobiales bacterium]
MTLAEPSLAAVLIVLSELPGVGPATLLECRSHPDPAALLGRVVSGRAHREAILEPAVSAFTRRNKAAGRSADPSEVAAGWARLAIALDPAEELARHRADGRSVHVLGEPGYPERLTEDPVPPALVFSEGDLSVLAGPTVAIVGTRNATRAGRDLAASLGAGLGRVGISVVSGLALGIDGAAHQGLVDAELPASGGRPIGVIASGLDIAYPSRHQRLHRDVVRTGVLLSETPLGLRPTAWRFPARNRIIAGLADAVVVVESRATGGSILTAGEAVARNVPVLAVPGHPTAPASAGTNDLIADGAILARDIEDVLVAVGRGGALDVVGGPVGEGEGDGLRPPDGPDEAAVLAVLGVDALVLDEVLARAGLSLADGSLALAGLEAKGLLERRGAWFERTTREARPGRTTRRSGR